MRVDTEIHLVVKIAFFTVFAFRHRSAETWRGGQLTSLKSETFEHGETVYVEGASTPDGFRVVSKAGPFIAPAATLTSNSLWTPAVLEQPTVVDAQHGAPFIPRATQPDELSYGIVKVVFNNLAVFRRDAKPLPRIV